MCRLKAKCRSISQRNSLLPDNRHFIWCMFCHIVVHYSNLFLCKKLSLHSQNWLSTRNEYIHNVWKRHLFWICNSHTKGRIWTPFMESITPLFLHWVTQCMLYLQFATTFQMGFKMFFINLFVLFSGFQVITNLLVLRVPHKYGAV